MSSCILGSRSHAKCNSAGMDTVCTKLITEVSKDYNITSYKIGKKLWHVPKHTFGTLHCNLNISMIKHWLISHLTRACGSEHIWKKNCKYRVLTFRRETTLHKVTKVKKFTSTIIHPQRKKLKKKKKNCDRYRKSLNPKLACILRHNSLFALKLSFTPWFLNSRYSQARKNPVNGDIIDLSNYKKYLVTDGCRFFSSNAIQ